MKNTLKGLQRLEDLVLVVAFVVMIAAIFIQVVNRNIFKIPVSGFEEAAKYCMVYMVMLGTELGVVMLSSGIGMVQKQLQTGQTSPGLGIPMAVPYAALPIAFGLIVVIQIGILVQMILNFNKPDEPKEKQEEVTE